MMTGEQKVILWIGLILISIRFFTAGQWQSIWNVVASGPGANATPQQKQQQQKRNCDGLFGPYKALCEAGIGASSYSPTTITPSGGVQSI